MKLILSVLFSSIALSLFAQEDDMYKEFILKENIKEAEFFDGKKGYNDKDDLYALSQKIITLFKDQKVKEFEGLRSDPLKNHHCAFIVVHNDFKVVSGAVNYDLKKVNSILLHKERKPGSFKKEWSEYMYQTRDIVIILLGNTGLDDKNNAINLGLNIINNESFFRTSFKDLVEVVKASFEAKGTSYGVGDGIPCRVVWLSKVKVNPPTEFDFSIPIKKEETTEDKANPISVEITEMDVSKEPKLKEPLDKLLTTLPAKSKVTFTLPNKITSVKTDVKKYSYKIHERNNFAFSIGLVGNKFNFHDFMLDTVRNVAIAKLDSVKKKEWKSNLNVNIEFYPFGRDIDQLEPFLKKPWHKLHTRFGIIGGVKLSKDPLSAVNAGLAFSYSKTVTITWGYSWLGNRVSDQSVKVDSHVTTIDQAKDYFSRKYERSKMTIGISFSPTQLAKALGIGEKKDEKKKGKEGD